MKTILIIEDNYDIRDNTAEILELADYEIMVAEDGVQGLYKIKERRPDLVLCDILMPKMNGFEVLRQLKNNPSTVDIPFIYVAASVEKDEVLMAMDMGADGYIGKPFEVEDLIEKVREKMALLNRE
ncbi:putative two-component response regulator [Fulvivirga imtechensis AK7]|uniref:Putative two-component response regulator n=1 Tax=Fulvivirga imtechensis AK7 TaxID=1237149 RepID=L8JUJ1_9BACT|nr:response regulator [Fulvivirga imtechensis]ELR71908.1 putative two-component response regulator [Fulvivirga imtechensis AK7]